MKSQNNNMKLFDVYPLYDVNLTKAKDVFVYDKDGNKYLDLYGGHAWPYKNLLSINTR